MSDTTTGASIRQALDNESQAITLGNYLASSETYDGTGSIAAPSTAPGSLTIDLSAGATGSTQSVPTGYGFIENVNDTGTLVGLGTSSTAGTLFYQGDAPGQTFFTGPAQGGQIWAEMTGFGNTLVATDSPSGTFVLATGLADATQYGAGLATPTTVNGVEQGNTIVAGAGTASIAAGLGANAIFLGSGTDVVASEGDHDSIVAGSGSATIEATGSATVYGAAGSVAGGNLLYNDNGTGSVVVQGSSVAGGGALTVYGYGGSVSATGGTGANILEGGVGGSNVLVGGVGASSNTLVGGLGTSNDTLIANGSNLNVLVAGAGSGNATLFGGAATGSVAFFTGAGSDTVVGGNEQSDYVQFGGGSSAVFAGSGTLELGLVSPGGGSFSGTDTVVGFDASKDFLTLSNFGTATTAQSILSSADTVGGSTVFTLADGTTIDLYGVTNLTQANFV